MTYIHVSIDQDRATDRIKPSSKAPQAKHWKQVRPKSSPKVGEKLKKNAMY